MHFFFVFNISNFEKRSLTTCKNLAAFFISFTVCSRSLPSGVILITKYFLIVSAVQLILLSLPFLCLHLYLSILLISFLVILFFRPVSLSSTFPHFKMFAFISS
jgi:hypothetical protein